MNTETARLVSLLEPEPLTDIQASPDGRGIALDSVGIEGLRIPARIVDVDGTSVRTIITATAGVSVRARERGAHMSRLVDELQNLDGALRLNSLASLHRVLIDRSKANGASLEIAFPWFIEKAAPVSGIRSSLDLHVHYVVTGAHHEQPRMRQGVRVPVTTLCPCSKAISRHGAHNQRTLVSVDLDVGEWIPIKRLVDLVEAEASCEIYGLLKRADEKYVTEKAYENPKFVEDVARDVCLRLRSTASILRSRIRVESQESIHNHQAFASVEDEIAAMNDLNAGAVWLRGPVLKHYPVHD